MNTSQTLIDEIPTGSRPLRIAESSCSGSDVFHQQTAQRGELLLVGFIDRRDPRCRPAVIRDQVFLAYQVHGPPVKP